MELTIPSLSGSAASAVVSSSSAEPEFLDIRARELPGSAYIDAMKPLMQEAFRLGYERGKADGVAQERKAWREMPVEEDADVSV